MYSTLAGRTSRSHDAMRYHSGIYTRADKQFIGRVMTSAAKDHTRTQQPKHLCREQEKIVKTYNYTEDDGSKYSALSVNIRKVMYSSYHLSTTAGSRFLMLFKVH